MTDEAFQHLSKCYSAYVAAQIREVNTEPYTYERDSETGGIRRVNVSGMEESRDELDAATGAWHEALKMFGGVLLGEYARLRERSVATMQLQTGDVLMAHFNPGTDLHRQAYCLEKLAETFPDNKVIVLIDEPRLTVVKAADAPHIATG